MRESMITEIKNALYHADILYDYVEEYDADTIRAGGWKSLHFDQIQNITQYIYFKGITVVNGELVIEFMKH